MPIFTLQKIFNLCYMLFFVAAIRFFKHETINGHVIVSLMLLKSSLLSFFESYMKQKIPNTMKTNSIMTN